MNKIILVTFVGLLLVGCGKKSGDHAQSQTPKIETWQVTSYKDDMRGTSNKWLTLRSDNSADLNSPYNGDNRLQLDVLDSKSSNPKVFITIDKGQYDCGKYGCYSAVKFGNNPIQYLTFNEHDAAGSDGKILEFSDNSKAFVQNIRAFKNIIIELPFYRNGTRQFHFSTSGFNEAEKNL